MLCRHVKAIWFQEEAKELCCSYGRECCLVCKSSRLTYRAIGIRKFKLFTNLVGYFALADS